MIRSKIGAFIKLYDVPATQFWLGAVAIGLRYGSGDGTRASLVPGIVALVSVSVVLFFLMGVNDYFDIGIDSKKNERAVLANGEISMETARIAVGLVGVLGLALALSVSIQFFLFTLAVFVLISLYSVPPVRYKRFYPFSTIGEILGACMLFLVGVSVVSLPSSSALVVSTVVALVAASSRLRHEVRYADFDSQTDKRTFAVVHGANRIRLVSRFLLVLAVIEVAAMGFWGLLTVANALLAGLFIVLPLLVRQVQSSRYLRMTALVWGFALYLVALFLPSF
ncbi:MAG TPA: UbiA family prenyltransferase [Nitrososphaerales archaeon]|nr:UbiA family prenyltransferase [Nitrososphaerales archaeon]